MQRRYGLTKRVEEGPLRHGRQGIVGAARTRGNKTSIRNNGADTYTLGQTSSHDLRLKEAGRGRSRDEQTRETTIRGGDILPGNIEDIEQEKSRSVPALQCGQSHQGRPEALRPFYSVVGPGVRGPENLDPESSFCVFQSQKKSLSAFLFLRDVNQA